MKIKKKALVAINIPKIRSLLALELGHTEQWIIQLIKRNEPNSSLTTAAALKVIRKETGLGDEQILEEEKATA